MIAQIYTLGCHFDFTLSSSATLEKSLRSTGLNDVARTFSRHRHLNNLFQ